MVRPITVDEVVGFNALLCEHHWLGHRLTGQVMRYVAVADGLWVALIGFGSAALSWAARDRYLGSGLRQSCVGGILSCGVAFRLSLSKVCW